ncbi:MAG: alpha/beta hydrolase [Bergeyella sp.]|nr:alpha/beta hydrolase [Bergeyella sp.]
MKVYVISGLGADQKVLEKLKFNPGLEVVFLDWLIPEKRESFAHYVERMAVAVDQTKPFYLLGYSFGGIIVQEIHKIKKAKKIVILASITSHKEKPRLIHWLGKLKITYLMPDAFFGRKTILLYAYIRKKLEPNRLDIIQYFRVANPHYLRWSINKIIEWKKEKDPDVIQIMGDKDIVFPIKNTQPHYTIRGGTHLFPLLKSKEVSAILNTLFV